MRTPPRSAAPGSALTVPHVVIAQHDLGSAPRGRRSARRRRQRSRRRTRRTRSAPPPLVYAPRPSPCRTCARRAASGSRGCTRSRRCGFARPRAGTRPWSRWITGVDQERLLGAAGLGDALQVGHGVGRAVDRRVGHADHVRGDAVGEGGLGLGDHGLDRVVLVVAALRIAVGDEHDRVAPGVRLRGRRR